MRTGRPAQWRAPPLRGQAWPPAGKPSFFSACPPAGRPSAPAGHGHPQWKRMGGGIAEGGRRGPAPLRHQHQLQSQSREGVQGRTTRNSQGALSVHGRSPVSNRGYDATLLPRRNGPGAEKPPPAEPQAGAFFIWPRAHLGQYPHLDLDDPAVLHPGNDDIQALGLEVVPSPGTGPPAPSPSRRRWWRRRRP